MVEQSDCISVQCVPVGRWRLMSQPVVAPLPNKKLECSCHADTAHISVSASEGVANMPLRRCEVAMCMVQVKLAPKKMKHMSNEQRFTTMLTSHLRLVVYWYR